MSALYGAASARPRVDALSAFVLPITFVFARGIQFSKTIGMVDGKPATKKSYPNVVNVSSYERIVKSLDELAETVRVAGENGL
jgi:hypothetical protein